MKHVTAAACVLFTGVILVSMTVGEAPRRTPTVPVSPAPAAPGPEAPRAADGAALALESEVQRKLRRAAEREHAVERAEADFEARVEQLIESIDWSRAESRIRFPIDYAHLRAEFESARQQLDRDEAE
jgi:hypothetical protein